MLDQKVINDFTKIIAKNDDTASTPNLYGTIVIDSSGNKFVNIDGSTINTPVVSTLDVKNGDRVLVTIENHTATISSNLTTPASGYTATDLYKETVVGNETVLSGKVVDLVTQSADGKTKNYYTATEPTGGTYAVGDTWFDTSKGYAMSNWNGTEWVAYVIGSEAIGSLKTANIDAGAITADKISIDDLKALGATIGGFHIGDTSIYNGKASLLSSVAGVYVGTDGIACGNAANGFSIDGTTGIFKSGGAITFNSGNFMAYGTNYSAEINNVYLRCSCSGSQLVQLKLEGDTSLASLIRVPNQFDLYSDMYGYFVGVSSGHNCYLGSASSIYDTNIYSGGNTNISAGDDITMSCPGWVTIVQAIRCHSIRPTNDEQFSCGSSDARWTTVYAQHGSISTSDENEKNSIETLGDKYVKLFDLMTPIQFKYNGGDRVHTGFGARAVEKAMTQLGMTDMDLGALCKDTLDDGTIRYGLRYEEFIAILAAKIKQLETRIVKLEDN